MNAFTCRSLILSALGTEMLLATGAWAQGEDPLIPPTPREFRGVWVATVSNIDWPSEPGLSTEQQILELIAIMDRAAALNLNAVVFQVRTGCDALYASEIEPWSYYITGVEGQPPEPCYDPLTLAIEAAHARGLELHAWLNPFRARRGIYEHGSTHVSQTSPELVYDYSEDFEWLDPGRQEAQDLSFEVIMDVLRRHDVDAIHFDDYFYPYPIEGLDFPDADTHQAYLDEGGELSLLDWRRDNINRFLLRVRRGIQEEKPWVRFGISPFGFWRPGHPPEIEGFDAYDGIACDSLRWFQEGWIDYLAPQLYWAIGSPGQPYEPLLSWWIEQNTLGRHLWPGICPARISETERGERAWPASEIVDQIEIERGKEGSTGVILYHDRPLAENRDGIFDLLREVYAEDALPPATTWLDDEAPAPPTVALGQPSDHGVRRLHWAPGDAEPPWLFVLHTRDDGRWTQIILPGDQREHDVAEGTEIVAVSAVDRCGNESARTVRAIHAE